MEYNVADDHLRRDIMNRFSTLGAALALLCVAFAAAPHARADDQTTSPAPSTTEHDLSISVQAPQQSYAAGESIKADVFVRNTGTKDATIGGSAFDLSSFRFVVLDPSSHSLKLTAFGRKLLAVRTKVKTNTPVTIQAGWQRHYHFELSRMFDLTVPGMYSITAKRVVVVSSGDHGTSQVLLLTSDPIAITITGSPAATATTSTSTPPAAPPSNGNRPSGANTPRWTIAFVREGDVWEADGDGNNQRLVVHNGESPSWSPDKSMLAFARKGNVWISDPDGQNQRQLTDSASLEAGVDPVFSPDGKWIAYRSWSERTGIMVREVSIDGKIDKELLEDGEDPAW